MSTKKHLQAIALMLFGDGASVKFEVEAFVQPAKFFR